MIQESCVFLTVVPCIVIPCVLHNSNRSQNELARTGATGKDFNSNRYRQMSCWGGVDSTASNELWASPCLPWRNLSGCRRTPGRNGDVCNTFACVHVLLSSIWFVVIDMEWLRACWLCNASCTRKAIEVTRKCGSKCYSTIQHGAPWDHSEGTRCNKKLVPPYWIRKGSEDLEGTLRPRASAPPSAEPAESAVVRIVRRRLLRGAHARCYVEYVFYNARTWNIMQRNATKCDKWEHSRSLT